MNTLQVNIRLDEDVYKQLVEYAEKEGTTLSAVVRTAVYRTYPFVRQTV